MIERPVPERAAMASPCVNVCVIDDATRWCLGCGRTIEEIAGWGVADTIARQAIWARLPERMAALAAGPSSPRT